MNFPVFESRRQIIPLCLYTRILFLDNALDGLEEVQANFGALTRRVDADKVVLGFTKAPKQIPEVNA